MRDLFASFSSTVQTHWVDFIIYGAIAMVTLIGVFKCLIPLWKTTHALRRAIRTLQDHAGEKTDRPVWQEPRFMGKRLKGCWLRFLQNAEQLDHRGLPCNVEDYINDDTVTHGPGNATLAELIPSLLTSLGILGTFVGMTQGLTGLGDVSTTDSMMSGIQTLLTGMQFAFGTSVAGVACSLAFNMLNRIAQGSSYRAIDDFTEAFTQLAMQRPLDNDVQLICQNQDRNHLLGTVTETVSTQMASSIERAIGRAMQPVAQSMDNFLIGATRAQVDGVGHLVNQFVDRMNTSLNGQFLVLGQTISDINTHQLASVERLNQSMAAVAQIAEDVGRLHGVSQDVITRFEHYVSELGEARRRDEGFEQNSTALLGAMRQAADEQAQLILRLQQSQEELNRAMTRFTQAGSDTLSAMRREDDAHAAHLEQIGQTMHDAGETLSGSYQHFVQNVVEGVSTSLGMFERNMQGLTETLGEQLAKVQPQGTNGDTAAALSSMQQTLADMQQALERASQEG